MSDAKPDLRSALEAVIDGQRRELGPHPDSADLVAYHAGGLAVEAARRLQDHLVLCRRCARLLLELDAFAADAARPTDHALAPVVPIAPRLAARRSRWLAAMGSAAAAAAAVVLLSVWPYGEPLPGYAPSFHGNVQSVRAAEAEKGEIPVFVEGSRFDLQLQPDTTVAGPLTARAYLRRGDGLRPLSTATLEIKEDGVVSLHGVPGSDLHLPIGDHQLAVVVARPGELPSRRRLSDELEGDSAALGSRWAAFQNRIRVEAAPASPPGFEAPAAETERWVEYDGCRTILIGPVCVLEDDRRLILWVKHDPEAAIEIDAGGWWPRQRADPVAVGEGFRYEIEVARGTDQLVVEVERDDRRSVWALELASAVVEPDWLVAARQAARRQDLEAARQLLQAHLPELGPELRGSALGMLARIEMRDDPAAAVDHFRQASRAHLEAGRPSDAVNDATAAVYQLLQDRRFADAAEQLENLPVDALGGASEGRYYAAYWRGLLAEETGDLRAALAAMARASRVAERAGRPFDQIFSDDMLARQLSTVGQIDVAAEIHAGIRSRMVDLCPTAQAGSPEAGDRETSRQRRANGTLGACTCARLLTSRAWTWLLALEAGRPAEDPSPPLEQAERLLEQSIAGGETCAFPEDLPNVRFNLALAALIAGDPERARRDLDRAQIDPEALPRLALWQLDLEARIALADSRPARALDLYRDLGQSIDPGTSPEAAWRATFGRAVASADLGRTGEAIEACRRADDLLDAESLLVPMHGGRELFLAQRERAARFCLELLLAAGGERQALAAARRSASRVLRGLRLGASLADLDAQDRVLWDRTTGSYRTARDDVEALADKVRKGLPGDLEQRLEGEMEDQRRALRELLDQRLALLGGRAALAAGDPAAPAAGTLLLVYHPLPRGWAAFAAGGGEVTAHRIEPDGELASRLLEPFAGEIARASRIEVIAYGALRDVDFHTLPFAGGILLDHAPVVYRLDLPALPARPLPSPPRALVVSDPGLRSAPAEGRQVLNTLASGSGGWQVELLEDEDASEPEVRRQLAVATLFHYAGHADFDHDSRGWDSRLALARGHGLTVDDIFVSPRVPRWIVLSGCETGRESRAAPLPSIGLAQAFLVAGAEAVVAATAEVSDPDAAALAAAFYRHWDASTPLAVALRKAQLERRDQAPDSDWRKFRVIAR